MQWFRVYILILLKKIVYKSEIMLEVTLTDQIRYCAFVPYDALFLCKNAG
uniref:Uncharacterized protein n=1 Tax=Arundo donax TaxID=35708 RepID=A0A0A8Z2H9_ARUDO